MKSYEGQMPYIFVSYSHQDKEVIQYIEGIMRRHVRLWYDDGNQIGDDWADNIANHLLNAEAILLFLSRNAIDSVNVNSEILLALKYKKKIMPVFIEDFDLTPAMDIKLGTFHSIKIFDKEFIFAISRILDSIPKICFVQKKDPFYQNEKWNLYLIEKKGPQGIGSFDIVCKNDKEEKVLFTYPQMGPFELDTNINKCEEVVDDFFNEEGNSILILNVSVSVSLYEGILGDDVDELLTFAIVDPLTDDIKVIPLSFKMISSKTRKYHPGLNDEEFDKLYGRYTYGTYLELRKKIEKLFH